MAAPGHDMDSDYQCNSASVLCLRQAFFQYAWKVLKCDDPPNDE